MTGQLRSAPTVVGDPLIGYDLGDWLARVLAVVGRSWLRIVLLHLLALAAIVVLGGLFVLLGVAFYAAGHDSGTGHTSGWARALLAAMILLAGLVAVVFSMAVAAGGLWLATRQAAGEPAPVGRALRFGLARLGGVVGWSIVFGLLTLVGLVLCVLPGLYVLVTVTATLYGVVVFERGRGLPRRAFRLVNQRFWATVGRLVLWLLLVGALSTLSGGLYDAAGAGSSHLRAGWLALAVLVQVAVWLVSLAGDIAVSLVSYAWLRGVEDPSLSTVRLAAELGP
ncbi:MAG: hypothetical protein ACJ73S_30340 [Mycobacteriales bacterium]